MKKIVGYIGVLLLISIFVLTFLAYFVYSFDSTTNITHDGLGRRLYEAPFWATYLGRGNEWAGLFWKIVDIIVFWGGLLTSIQIMSWGFKDDSKQKESEQIA